MTQRQAVMAETPVADMHSGAGDLPVSAGAGDFFALMKPRVMSLVLFTALVGMLAAPGTMHPVIAAVALLCIAMAAGGSGAINMWYDADIDAIMTRTANRPIPAGRVTPGEALAFGVALSFASVIMMGLFVNLVAAALLALTIGFYIFVYTMWLKRRTPQNIVIGGAAGAFPPMVAWAAASGEVGLGAVAFFALIFMWTPPHFWALALYRDIEYAKAGVPMLPVVAGKRETQKQILIYAVLLLPISLGPALAGAAGVLYVAGALLLSSVFLAGAFVVWRAKESALEAPARRLFGFSILYLFLLFALILVERTLNLPIYGGVF